MPEQSRKTSIQLFIWEVIGLIDQGVNEPIESVNNAMSEGNIANYIYDKHGDKMQSLVEKRLNDINTEYFDISSYASGNEYRKFAVQDENNGLLLLVSIGLELQK